MTATHAAAGAAPLIELRNVTKTYGQGQAAFQALRGVDLRIDAGEFVAIMGPSGSGKSTAMNILGCLDAPTSGTYLFRGVRVETLSRQPRALLRRHYLGFVFQGFNLLHERRRIAENEDDNFTVVHTRQIAEALSGTTRIMTMLLGAVAAVSLLVGGIGIMNIMLVSVTERTREIGIRLAIGAFEREVLLQFLVEAAALSSFGGLIGIARAAERQR